MVVGEGIGVSPPLLSSTVNLRANKWANSPPRCRSFLATWGLRLLSWIHAGGTAPFCWMCTAVLKGQGLSSVQDSFPTRCLDFVMYILGSSLLIICSTPSSCPCISPCLSFKLYQKLPYQASCNTKTLYILFNELNCPGTRQSSCGWSPDLWYRNVSQQHCTEFESKAKPSCAQGILASKTSGRARWLA